MDANLKKRLYLISDEMRGMATVQKTFAQSIYETERAHRIMELAAEVAALAEQRPVVETKAVFEAEPWRRYSPAIGVEAAVFNTKGEILLIQRRDNGRWALPGGLYEIGQTMAEAVLRELWEEAGLRGEVRRLLGMFDGGLWGSQVKVHIVNAVFLVECPDLSPAPGSECLDAAFFARDALPEAMHPGHDRRVPACFDALRGKCYFDPADSLDGAMPMYQRPAEDAAR